MKSKMNLIFVIVIMCFECIHSKNEYLVIDYPEIYSNIYYSIQNYHGNYLRPNLKLTHSTPDLNNKNDWWLVNKSMIIEQWSGEWVWLYSTYWRKYHLY